MEKATRRTTRLLLAGIIAPIAALSALEWPVAGGFPSIPFGTFHAGRFLTSMAASPAGSPVRAAAQGDIAFLFDGDKLPSGLPCTLGGFVAVSHPDGMVSVYNRLERGSLPSYIRTVSEGDVLARAGASGYYSSRELMFTLYDRVKRQYLNPQVLLPLVRDDRAPVVRAIYLASGGKYLPLGEKRILRQGTYEVIADIQDPASAAETRPRAPYSLRLLIDGIERLRFVYDAARSEGGRLKFFGSAGMDTDSYYLEDGRVRLGSFLLSRGRSTIVLIVTDYAGNEREISNIVQME